MTQFTFTPHASRDETAVRIDGTLTGHIKRDSRGGCYYQPKGSKTRGVVFATFDACKRDVLGDALPVSLVEGRDRAYAFLDETEVRLACMEARDGTAGICAGEPAGAFGMVRIEGETGFYVQYHDSDEQCSVQWLTRGQKT